MTGREHGTAPTRWLNPAAPLRAALVFVLVLPAFPVAEARTAPSPAGPTAPVRPDPRINAILARISDKHHVPALFAGIVRGSALVALGAVGVRKAGVSTPVQPDDQIHIGSDTKAMTATLLAQLVEEKKLRWDSTLGQIFPRLAGELGPVWRSVTIDQLLTHTAGVPPDTPWAELAHGSSLHEQRLRALRWLARQTPFAKPGTRFAYSNLGYVIAGLVAEQLTGEPWEQLMRERLFGPLSMTSAGFGPPGTPGKIDQPWGPSALSAQLANEVLPSAGFSADVKVRIAQAIEDHSYSRGAVPRSPLGQALQDADRLEALGALGVLRTASCGVRLGARYLDLHDPWARRRGLDDHRFTVDHFFVKLLRLEETLHTDKGRAEARRRTAFMRAFLRELGEEIGEPLEAGREATDVSRTP